MSYTQTLELKLLTLTNPLVDLEEFTQAQKDWLAFKIPCSHMIVFYARRIKALEEKLNENL